MVKWVFRGVACALIPALLLDPSWASVLRPQIWMAATGFQAQNAFLATQALAGSSIVGHRVQLHTQPTEGQLYHAVDRRGFLTVVHAADQTPNALPRLSTNRLQDVIQEDFDAVPLDIRTILNSANSDYLRRIFNFNERNEAFELANSDSERQTITRQFQRQLCLDLVPAVLHQMVSRNLLSQEDAKRVRSLLETLYTDQIDYLLNEFLPLYFAHYSIWFGGQSTLIFDRPVFLIQARAISKPKIVKEKISVLGDVPPVRLYSLGASVMFDVNQEDVPERASDCFFSRTPGLEIVFDEARFLRYASPMVDLFSQTADIFPELRQGQNPPDNQFTADHPLRKEAYLLLGRAVGAYTQSHQMQPGDSADAAAITDLIWHSEMRRHIFLSVIANRHPDNDHDAAALRRRDFQAIVATGIDDYGIEAQTAYLILEKLGAKDPAHDTMSNLGDIVIDYVIYRLWRSDHINGQLDGQSIATSSEIPDDQYVTTVQKLSTLPRSDLNHLYEWVWSDEGIPRGWISPVPIGILALTAAGAGLLWWRNRALNEISDAPAPLKTTAWPALRRLLPWIMLIVGVFIAFVSAHCQTLLEPIGGLTISAAPHHLLDFLRDWLSSGPHGALLTGLLVGTTAAIGLGMKALEIRRERRRTQDLIVTTEFLSGSASPILSTDPLMTLGARIPPATSAPFDDLTRDYFDRSIRSTADAYRQTLLSILNEAHGLAASRDSVQIAQGNDEVRDQLDQWLRDYEEEMGGLFWGSSTPALMAFERRMSLIRLGLEAYLNTDSTPPEELAFHDLNVAAALGWDQVPPISVEDDLPTILAQGDLARLALAILVTSTGPRTSQTPYLYASGRPSPQSPVLTFWPEQRLNRSDPTYQLAARLIERAGGQMRLSWFDRSVSITFPAATRPAASEPVSEVPAPVERFVDATILPRIRRAGEILWDYFWRLPWTPEIPEHAVGYPQRHSRRDERDPMEFQFYRRLYISEPRNPITAPSATPHDYLEKITAAAGHVRSESLYNYRSRGSFGHNHALHHFLLDLWPRVLEASAAGVPLDSVRHRISSAGQALDWPFGVLMDHLVTYATHPELHLPEINRLSSELSNLAYLREEGIYLRIRVVTVPSEAGPRSTLVCVPYRRASEDPRENWRGGRSARGYPIYVEGPLAQNYRTDLFSEDRGILGPGSGGVVFLDDIRRVTLWAVIPHLLGYPILVDEHHRPHDINDRIREALLLDHGSLETPDPRQIDPILRRRAAAAGLHQGIIHGRQEIHAGLIEPPTQPNRHDEMLGYLESLSGQIPYDQLVEMIHIFIATRHAPQGSAEWIHHVTLFNIFLNLAEAWTIPLTPETFVGDPLGSCDLLLGGAIAVQHEGVRSAARTMQRQEHDLLLTWRSPEDAGRASWAPIDWRRYMGRVQQLMLLVVVLAVYLIQTGHRTAQTLQEIFAADNYPALTDEPSEHIPGGIPGDGSLGLGRAARPPDFPDYPFFGGGGSAGRAPGLGGILPDMPRSPKLQEVPKLNDDEMFMPPLTYRLPFRGFGGGSLAMPRERGLDRDMTMTLRPHLEQDRTRIFQAEKELLEKLGVDEYIRRYWALYSQQTGHPIPPGALAQMDAEDRAALLDALKQPKSPLTMPGRELENGQQPGGTLQAFVIVKKKEYDSWLRMTVESSAAVLALPNVNPENFLLYGGPHQQGPIDRARRSQLAQRADPQNPAFDYRYGDYVTIDNAAGPARTAEARIYRRHWGTWGSDLLSERALLVLLGPDVYVSRITSLKEDLQRGEKLPLAPGGYNNDLIRKLNGGKSPARAQSGQRLRQLAEIQSSSDYPYRPTVRLAEIRRILETAQRELSDFKIRRELLLHPPTLDMTWLARSVEWGLQKMGLAKPERVVQLRKILVPILEQGMFLMLGAVSLDSFPRLLWILAFAALFGALHTGQSGRFRVAASLWGMGSILAAMAAHAFGGSLAAGLVAAGVALMQIHFNFMTIAQRDKGRGLFFRIESSLALSGLSGVLLYSASSTRWVDGPMWAFVLTIVAGFIVGRVFFIGIHYFRNRTQSVPSDQEGLSRREFLRDLLALAGAWFFGSVEQYIQYQNLRASTTAKLQQAARQALLQLQQHPEIFQAVSIETVQANELLTRLSTFVSNPHVLPFRETALRHSSFAYVDYADPNILHYDIDLAHLLSSSDLEQMIVHEMLHMTLLQRRIQETIDEISRRTEGHPLEENVREDIKHKAALVADREFQGYRLGEAYEKMRLKGNVPAAYAQRATELPREAAEYFQNRSAQWNKLQSLSAPERRAEILSTMMDKLPGLASDLLSIYFIEIPNPLSKNRMPFTDWLATWVGEEKYDRLRPEDSQPHANTQDHEDSRFATAA